LPTEPGTTSWMRSNRGRGRESPHKTLPAA